MSKQTYPKYRLQTWGDVTVSPIRKFYGIDMQRYPGDRWWHCANGTEPLFFDEFDAVQTELKVLRKRARAAIAKATGEK